VCQDLVTSWEDGEASEVEEGWCSWCFEETTQVLFCRGGLSRNLYQCSYCEQVTARCMRCCKDFARSHQDWTDSSCAACSGIIAQWGIAPSLDSKAKIKLWCSACVRHTIQDLVQLNSITSSRYRCTNCHATCITCPCGIATLAIEPPTNSPTSHVHTVAHTKDGCVAKRCLGCLSGERWEQLDREHRAALSRSNEPSQSAMLQQFQAKLLQELIAMSDVRPVKKGEMLVVEGSSERRLILLVCGSVAVERKDKGKNQVVAVVGAGTTIGEIVFLKGGAATASVRAVSDDAQAAIIDGHVLDSQLNSSDGTFEPIHFFKFLAVHLCERLRQTTSTSPTVLSRTHPGQGLQLGIGLETDRTVAGGGLEYELGLDREQARDSVFCKKFNIHASEYVINHCHAALMVNANRPLWGRAGVTQSYFCFGGDVFGQETCLAIHYSMMRSLREVDKEGVTLLELTVVPTDEAGSDEDARFCFLFHTGEDREIFVADLLRTRKQEHVWKNSRGKIRKTYKVEKDEDAIYISPEELAKQLTEASSAGPQSQARRNMLPWRKRSSNAAGGEGRTEFWAVHPKKPSGRKEAMSLMESSSVMPRVYHDGMAKLVQGAKAITFQRGDTIIHEGNRDGLLYQLGIGRVRVEKGCGRDRKVLALLHPGEIIGEVSFLAGGPASASVVADVDNTTCYVFAEHCIKVLVEADTHIAVGFYRYLANVLADRLRALTVNSM